MAHPDLEQLMNFLIPFAQQMLAKHGDFYPFGASMKTDGQIVAHGAYEGDENPPSQPLIDLLTEAFRRDAGAGEIRAAGICYDVRTIPPGQSDKTDAICISLEHQNGEAVNVCLPYKKGWFGKISYGEIFGTTRTRQFFA